MRVQSHAMTAHHHAIVWIDHREAKLFHLNTTEVDRMILHPHRPTRHIHRNATSIGGGTSLLDDDYFEHVSEATAEAKAILIAGPDSAKSELAAHLTRHHPEAAARIVGVETVNHPSDGAFAAVARLHFNTKDNSQPQISQTDLGS
jgi:stalled ribosome rescue protein Dom34